MSSALLWVAFGLLLLGAEAALPGPLVLLFFGVGAMVVAFALALGAAIEPVSQLAVFASTSIVSMLLLRGSLRRRFGGHALGHPVAGIEGEVATLRQAIAPGETGQAEFRGTVWSARHAGASTLAEGTRCRVLRIEELTLWVEPEGATAT